MTSLAVPRADDGGPGPAMRRRLVEFLHLLRQSGFTIGRAEAADAARLMTSPAADRIGSFRDALRALLASSQPELARFDAIFDTFWRANRTRPELKLRVQGSAAKSPPRLGEAPGPGATGASGMAGIPGGGGAGGAGRQGGASTHDSITTKDIGRLANDAEREAAASVAERIAKAMRARITRRERLRAKGRRVDLRATIRRSIASGGEPIDLKFRRRKVKPLRLIALLDASGSMEPYVAVFSRFLHALSHAFRQSETFLFHTRLAHVSSALRDRDAQRALDRLALMAQGIGGGTRIGDCIGDFNRAHARRVINSRTCVMILSDGYDTGEPERLASTMRTLRRRCKRIVWLNPLTGREGFAPVARGMQAATPYLDLFAPAHDLESLVALEPYLARI